MSKTVNIQTLQPGGTGPVFGQKARTADFNNLQVFARQHVENLSKDFLIDAKGVVGFDYTVVGGNSRQINIIAPGRGYDEDGVQYDFEANVTLTFQAADAQPRIDLVVVALDKNVAAASESVAFARIRTQTEIEQAISPFVPTQFNVVTQKQNVASVRVVKGTAAANPVVPAHGANEVVLYQVAVAANSTSVIAVNITDVRPLIRSIRYLTNLITANNGSNSNITTSLISDFNPATDARANARIAAAALQPLSAKNQANGYLGLDSTGMIDSARIYALKSHEFVIAANAAARLALTTTNVQPGDECFQNDTGENYKLISTDPTQTSSWKLISDVTPDWSVIANKPAVFPTAIGSAVVNALAGSIFFAGAGAIIAQDNSNLFFDNTNKRLGVGTLTPRRRTDFLDGAAPQMRLSRTENTIYTDFQTDGSGNLIISLTGGNVQVNAGIQVNNISYTNTQSFTASRAQVGMGYVGATDVVGSFLFQGYTVSGYQPFGMIEVVATSDHTAEIRFWAKTGSGFGNNINVARFDSAYASVGETGLILLESGAYKRVTCGANDSGGSGYKLLRIAN